MGVRATVKMNLAAAGIGLRDAVKYGIPYFWGGDRWLKKEISEKFYNSFGRVPDFENPMTMNEKLQVLKLCERDAFYTQCVDKYRAREIWSQYGEDGLVPLVIVTRDVKDLKPENLPDYPFIIKSNAGFASNIIVRDKNRLDYEALQFECKKWLARNYFYVSQEYAHKNVKRMILVEKLLMDRNGRIPNDYKLHYFNGELQFVYCSIDREGKNYRSIYNPEWQRMDMEWVGKGRHKGGLYGDNIEEPGSFARMKSIGGDLSKKFKYVRLDFYDVDGKLYYGEITLYHGSGFDTFEPSAYDEIYGSLLKL